MNDQRRRKIKKLLKEINSIQEQLTSIKEEEQDAFDNLPEGLQQSDKGAEMENTIQQFEEAEEHLAVFIESLENVGT
jgi:flagellar biosynthesis chaperone FliJ